MSNWRRAIEQNEAAVSASTKRSGGPTGLLRLSKAEESGSDIRRSDINLLGGAAIRVTKGKSRLTELDFCYSVPSSAVESLNDLQVSIGT
jgi:hypothetical protein